MMSENLFLLLCAVLSVKEWDTRQDNVKESKDVQDVEENMIMENVVKMQKLDVVIVAGNTVLLLEDVLFKNKLERCRNIK